MQSPPPLPVYTGAHTVISLQLIKKIRVHVRAFNQCSWLAMIMMTM